MLRRLLPLILFACTPSTESIPDSTIAAATFVVQIPGTQQTPQMATVFLPAGYTVQGPARPLVVLLHMWGGNYTTVWQELADSATANGWLVVAPDYHGDNTKPIACGSLTAQQDVLDATAWAVATLPVDPHRVYLTGASGGGHMALLLAGRHPEAFTAVSAWASISDLTAWHDSDTLGYARQIEQCTGGAPGASPAVDAEYRARSPMTWLASAKTLPLEISAGIRDGHPGSDETSGSVPIAHSLRAFNVIARSVGSPDSVRASEIAELSASVAAHLHAPHASDTVHDPTFGRRILLRRTAGHAVVTIFDGGHEGLAPATLAWLSHYRRP